MNRLLMCSLLTGFLVVPHLFSVAGERRPNFILINCDDLGYGDVSCYGAAKQSTPNVDRLAKEGIRFTSFYSSSGVCTPSRTSLMTACYPRRVNMHTNGVGYWVLFPGNERGLNPDEVTVAEVLRGVGYATMCVGKWHLGDQPPFLPTRQGFDRYFGIPFSNDMGQTRAKGQRDPKRPPTPLLKDDKVLEEEPDQRYLTRRYTDEALQFITENQKRPFLLYLAHSFPHWPHYASEAFSGKSANGVYGDCIEEVDWSTGQIVAKLKELGLEKQTLVVFTSDNGGVRAHGASNGPLKAGKATSFEGGHRVPCVVWAPGRVPSGKVCDKVWTMLDVLPTFAALAGAKAPSDRILDGFDESRLLLKPESAESPYDKAGYFYYYEGHLQAVRCGRWKLRVAKDGPKLGSTPLPKPELYDLDADIGETTDVAGQNPEVVARLLPLLERCRADIGDGDRPGKNQRPAGRYPGAKPLTPVQTRERGVPRVGFRVRLDVITEGYDRKSDWFQPRIGVIPPATAVLTMTKAQLWGSDIFTAIQEMRSDDFGRTWSAPKIHPTLGRRKLAGDAETCPCDLTPAWHAKTGKLLMTGHTANYHGGARGGLILDKTLTRDTSYSVYDPVKREWSEWKTLRLPDREHLFWAMAGCTQRVDLPDGDILLPLYCLDRRSVGDNFWKRCMFATVARCAFDGTELRYLEHGDELFVADPRGFCEPSLTRFGDRFYLTLRNDVKGYVAASRDGMHFDKPVPWTFDDGRELGSYNTQQHWVTHSEGLFLVYTRRGAGNDYVIRHRAPLWIAQVDPVRLCVLRDTERELVPNHGAQLGNFGAVGASKGESWVVTSEHMQGDAKQPLDLERTEKRGANARVYLARIQWDRPNRLVTW